MADNLGVNPKTAFSSDVEGLNFPVRARVLVAHVANLNVTDTYVVMFTFVLGNYKALVSTKMADGRYYEVTYNVDKEETYVDVYQKINQEVFPDV